MQPFVRDDPWHHIDLLCIRTLTSARAFAGATCSARSRARSRRSLNILTAREPMGLSSRRRLILLASHRMALTRERKNSSRIAREIEIFSIFAWLVPTLVPKHNSRFWVCCRTICWSWWSINIYETFGRNKIAVSLWNFVSASCSESGPNLRTLGSGQRYMICVTLFCTLFSHGSRFFDSHNVQKRATMTRGHSFSLFGVQCMRCCAGQPC